MDVSKRRKSIKAKATKERDVLPRTMAAKAAKATRTAPVPVIGIGASAGGLEALEAFFSRVPELSGLIFVIIQHLDPKHKSMMSSLLKKYTSMEIFEIQDGINLKVNCIYLAPPDQFINISKNRLRYEAPEASNRLALPIDHFLRSLAEDQRERAIGVLLSGTGTDGTLGLKAIKETGGMSMVQSVEQAKYAGMPQSAMDAGIVDFILPVEEMPGQIIRYAHHPYLEMATKPKVEAGDFQTSIQKILMLINQKTRHDFTPYKSNTIRRRIERRMALHRITKFSDYVRYLEETPGEIDSLFKEILINVTRFFRDPEVFESLGKKVLPALLAAKEKGAPFRIWVPGCSSGEEAYSLAMLLTEVMEKHNKKIPLQIFASDIDQEAIDSGRTGGYPDSIRADVSEERLGRFFTRTDGAFRIKKQIRDCVVFALQDIAKDPPFSRLDMISCRNVLIYMDQPIQKRILSVFHYSLVNGGVLLLGTSESAGELAGSFSVTDVKSRIYRKKGLSSLPLEYPRFLDQVSASLPGKVPLIAGAGLRPMAEKFIAQYFSPPAVLVNDKFDVLYFYGTVDRYLAVSTGEASFNLLRIVREGLRHILGPALAQASKSTMPVQCKNVQVYAEGGNRTVDLLIQPVMEPGEAQRMLLVVFNEKVEADAKSGKGKRPARAVSPSAETAALKQELISTREYLQSTIEELQTTNEEFQSTNEELQSTNEELETSKEELQSTNEELVTVNAELQNKVDQLTETNNDVNNLLAGTDIASIFLDMQMRIKRFTPAMVSIFRLLQTDIGRSIRDITSNISAFDIYHAAREVLDTLVRKEVEVVNEAGRWFALKIIPYRTMENTISGIVLTFSDITSLKDTVRQLEETNLLAQGIVDTKPDPFVVLDGDLNIISVNSHFYDLFKVRPEDTLKRRVYDLGNGQWDIPQLKELLENIIPQNALISGYSVDREFPGIGPKTISLDARRISNTNFLILSFKDVSNPGEQAAKKP